MYIICGDMYSTIILTEVLMFLYIATFAISEVIIKLVKFLRKILR